jgi:hypothetical protein
LTKEGLIFSKGQLISKKRENTLFSKSGLKKADVKQVSIFNKTNTIDSSKPQTKTSLTTTLFDHKGRTKIISTKNNVFSEGKLISHKKSEKDLTKENALEDLFSKAQKKDDTGKKIDISGLKIFGGPAKTTKTSVKKKGFWSGKIKGKKQLIVSKIKAGMFSGEKSNQGQGKDVAWGSHIVTVKPKDL